MKRVGIFNRILQQERNPIFTGLTIAISFVTVNFMFLTYARWHTGLSFGALGVPFIYGFIALGGIVMNTTMGCIAMVRRECYGGRVALFGSAVCIVGAFVFVRLTLR